MKGISDIYRQTYDSMINLLAVIEYLGTIKPLGIADYRI
jgi:hypothetical protein